MMQSIVERASELGVWTRMRTQPTPDYEADRMRRAVDAVGEEPTLARLAEVHRAVAAVFAEHARWSVCSVEADAPILGNNEPQAWILDEARALVAWLEQHAPVGVAVPAAEALHDIHGLVAAHPTATGLAALHRAAARVLIVQAHHDRLSGMQVAEAREPEQR